MQGMPGQFCSDSFEVFMRVYQEQHLGMFSLQWGPPVFLEGLLWRRREEGLDAA